MTIASQYAVLSKDRKTLVFPDDVQNWLKNVDRFVVVMENDGLILKKAHSRRTLEEMVTKEKEPLSDERLNELIHGKQRGRHIIWIQSIIKEELLQVPKIRSDK
jgi:hypothetical protein